MSTTTAKHREFICEPIGEKKVTAIAGIGEVYADKLINLGYDRAYTVLAQYLIFHKDEKKFKQWFKVTCGANERYTTLCYNCIHEWAKAFI